MENVKIAEKRKKIVIFLNSIEDLPIQLPIINQYSKDSQWKALVFAGDYPSQKWLKNQGIEYRTSKDYLDKERHKRPFIEANRFVFNWYRHPQIEEDLTYKGICIGKVFEGMLRSSMQSFLTYITLYKTVIDTEKPQKISLLRRDLNKIRGLSTPFDSLVDSYILSRLASQKQIEICWVNLNIDSVRTILIKLNNFYENLLKTISRTYNSLKELFYLRRHADIKIFKSMSKRISLPRKPILTYLKKKKSAKKIFFYPNLRCMETVALYLKKKEKHQIICLFNGNKIFLERFGILRIGLQVFNCPDIDNKVDNYKKKLLAIFKKRDCINHFKNFFYYEGIHFWPIVRPKIEYFFQTYFPHMVRVFELAKICHKEIGIDVFISPGDQNSFIRMIILALKEEGIPTLRVQHGLYYLSPEGTQLYSQYYIPIYHDRVMAWGKASRDWLVNNGVPEEKVVVSSCCDFDRCLGNNLPDKKRLHRLLGIKKGSRVILYALNHYHLDASKPYLNETRDEILLHLKDVIETISKIANAYLIVRPHPEQDERNNRDIFNLLADYKRKNIIVTNIPFFFQVRACDILINYSSTAALDAMILGKNVIIYNPSGRPELIPYAQDGAAIKVTKKEDLLPTINRLYNDINLRQELSEKRKNFVKYCIGEINGLATRNIAEFITKEVNSI